MQGREAADGLALAISCAGGKLAPSKKQKIHSWLRRAEPTLFRLAKESSGARLRRRETAAMLYGRCFTERNPDYRLVRPRNLRAQEIHVLLYDVDFLRGQRKGLKPNGGDGLLAPCGARQPGGLGHAPNEKGCSSASAKETGCETAEERIGATK